MRTSKFREEQIIAILKEAEAGMKTDDVCRRHGISRQTPPSQLPRGAHST